MSRTPIYDAHKLVGERQKVSRKMMGLEAITPRNGLDAAILRTCRQIYLEALPILYEMNTFHFTNPLDMNDFLHQGLNSPVPQFGLHRTEDGRLSLIKDLQLIVGPRYNFDNSRSGIIGEWFSFIKGRNTMAFRIPQLRMLWLDFTPWAFRPEEGSVVDYPCLISLLLA